MIEVLTGDGVVRETFDMDDADVEQFKQDVIGTAHPTREGYTVTRADVMRKHIAGCWTRLELTYELCDAPILVRTT